MNLDGVAGSNCKCDYNITGGYWKKWFKGLGGTIC